MNPIFRNAVALVGALVATQAIAQVVFYEREGFAGRSFTAEGPIEALGRFAFNERGSSVVVLRDRWEACEHTRFRGRCVVLRPGRYPSLASMALNARIASVRTVSRNSRMDFRRFAPLPAPVYDNHRRDQERLYDAQVISVRAAVGGPEQRCWVEREQVAQEYGGASVPGASAGAVIGGVLGHQMSTAHGNDTATVGGVVAGVGATVGRYGVGQQTQVRDVPRCASAPGHPRPEYWDVTYSFRGLDHYMQLMSPPGPIVAVNELGEPRAWPSEERSLEGGG